MPLDPDERSDALDALEDAGRDGATFEFRFVAYPRQGCGVGPPPADIIVINKATGVERNYPAGRGATWLVKFRADIARQFFWP